MKEFIVTLLIFGGGSVFAGWLLCVIIDAFCEHKMLKKRMEHPKFYGWIAELNEKIDEEARYRINEIAPLKQEIDKMIAEMPYLTAEKQVQMVGVLEDYREILADRQCELKRMEFESAKLRKKIREYNAKHVLEKGWDG